MEDEEVLVEPACKASAIMEADRHRQKSAAKEAEAWRLRVQGWTQARIATHLKCSQQAVSLMLAKLERKFHDELIEQAAEVKARQTAQLEALYESLVEQWERSCRDAERVTTVSGLAKATEHGYVDLPDRETRVVEGQSGNPALIAQALAAQAAIRAIWGLEAPKRQEVSGPEGGPVRVSEVVVELPRGGG